MSGICTCPEAGGVYDPACPAHSPAPPPDTAVRLTARQLAHRFACEDNGQGGRCCGDKPMRGGEGVFRHSLDCDALTAAIEADRRSHTDELREAAELVRAWLTSEEFDENCATSDALEAWLARYDERTRKGDR